MPKETFKKLSCSPLSDKDFDFTCYDKDDLEKLKETYNKRHRDDPIKSEDPKTIWDTLRDKYHNVCNTESCWLRREFMPSQLGKQLVESFAPEHPESWNKNDHTWLSSSDIQKVMKQFEKRYKCFEFIGPSPIDFYKTDSYDEGKRVWPELYDFNVDKNIRNNKFKIGIIFNLDEHTESGSHWVALFLNLRKKKLYFFDSVKTSSTNKEPPEIKKLVKCIVTQGEKLNIKIDYELNDKIVHQRKNTECGVYCLFFIINMLQETLTWEAIMSKRITDNDVHKYRKTYFNNNV